MEKTAIVNQYPLSTMAEGLVGSEIIKLAMQVKARIRNGEDIHNLTIGDFDPGIFPIPDRLLEEIIKAYREGETNYPASNGMQELRESVSSFLRRRQGLDYIPDNILISAGARPIIYAAFMAIIDPGDKVLVPVPSWNNNHYAHISGAECITVQTKAQDNFMPNAKLFAPHISDITLIALCSPLNPTGTAFSEDQLGEICDLVLEENLKRGPDQKPVYLLYDQIYWNLTYGQTLHVHPVGLRPEMRDFTIYVDGMSKVFAATGVRVGWGFGTPKLIHKMKAILSHLGAWAPKAEQMATGRYLSAESAVDNFIEHMRNEIETRLLGFYKGLSDLKNQGYPVDVIPPMGAMYLTVRFDLAGRTRADGHTIQNTAETTAYLLEEAGTALVPFYAFGADPESSWFRLSVGTCSKQDVQLVLTKLQTALKKLS